MILRDVNINVNMLSKSFMYKMLISKQNTRVHSNWGKLSVVVFSYSCSILYVSNFTFSSIDKVTQVKEAGKESKDGRNKVAKKADNDIWHILGLWMPVQHCSS